jgi:hypothetical protein
VAAITTFLDYQINPIPSSLRASAALIRNPCLLPSRGKLGAELV